VVSLTFITQQGRQPISATAQELHSIPVSDGGTLSLTRDPLSDEIIAGILCGLRWRMAKHSAARVLRRAFESPARWYMFARVQLRRNVCGIVIDVTCGSSRSHPDILPAARRIGLRHQVPDQAGGHRTVRKRGIGAPSFGTGEPSRAKRLSL